MSRWFRSLLGVTAVATVLIGIVSSSSCSAQVAAASGTIQVVARVEPVRYIFVNGSGKITEILSNCQQNVTPVVYRGKLGSSAAALSPAINKQYLAILSTIKTSHAGVIYKLSTQPKRSSPALADKLSIIRNQSVLFRLIHA